MSPVLPWLQRGRDCLARDGPRGQGGKGVVTRSNVPAAGPSEAADRSPRGSSNTLTDRSAKASTRITCPIHHGGWLPWTSVDPAVLARSFCCGHRRAAVDAELVRFVRGGEHHEFRRGRMLSTTGPHQPRPGDVQGEIDEHLAVETADRGVARLWRVLTRRMRRLAAIMFA